MLPEGSREPVGGTETLLLVEDETALRRVLERRLTRAGYAVTSAADGPTALALAEQGERICWVARDAEIGDRVADELGAWLGDPGLVAVLEPRTSLAYERSELVPDETAARVAALAAWRSGKARVLVASVQALLQATIAPDDLPAKIRVLRPGGRTALDTLLADLFNLGYAPVLEVAGRGEFARRGGIVDVFPPSATLPVRIELFGDEIDSMRAFDPTDQRSVEAVREIALLPATEFLLPAGGAAELKTRLGKLANKLPERLALDLARFAGEAVDEGAAPLTAGRALAAGDAAEVWARLVAPSTGLDHLDATTLMVLDEPGDLADAADFLWRQAEERHKELVEQGELPKDWPSGFLPSRDWKARLHGARTLELTWQSDASEAAGMAFAAKGLTSGDLFGWREPVLPPGRTERLVDGVEHWLAEKARVVLASDQAARLAELLGEAGHPVGILTRIAEPPPPGAIALIERSLNGGFFGGPDGLAVVTDRELFGNVRVRRPKAMRRIVPRDILERLTTGDLVVHIDHGIARYEQMLRRGEDGQERDYLELSFAAGDRIFVPVEQINRVSRYSG
ncbi:MAG: CarD family transcriptional regulator, partial [Chloroflexales bacterium]